VVYEMYLNRPDQTSPAELQTQIVFPLKTTWRSGNIITSSRSLASSPPGGILISELYPTKKQGE
jgi:hypothetical protein